MRTKFIYRVMHACIEFKLKFSDIEEIFSPHFWQSKLISEDELILSSTDRGKYPRKGFQRP